MHSLSFARGWPHSEFERLLAGQGVVADGGYVGERLSGFVLSRSTLDEAEILTVAVHPDFRARGLAGSMLAFHLSRLAAVGSSQVFLEVDEANEPALRLYRRLGFQSVGKRPGYYSQGREKTATALVLRASL